jgi:hypothetical protein
MKNFVAIAVLSAIAGTASAQTVSSWNLLGQSGSQASVAGTGSANVTASLLARGAGLSGNAGANSINAAGWTGQATDYFSFGFTVAAGFQTDLSTLFIGSRSSGTGPGTVGLFSSLNGFASPITTWSQPDSTFVNQAINLSALPNITGNVEFRIAQIGTTAANGGATGTSGTFRLTAYFVGGSFDRDLQFTGTTTLIPTPGALALAGFAGVFGARRRRTA